jgi:CRISPR type III-B/RAMP module RAMP protein Cmr1
MTRESFKIEIITPCFCAGADQSKAEIRPASIRGQLRWWFRLIDHNPKHESAIFGSVSGDDDCSASALLVRVSDFKPSGRWPVPSINQNEAENYIWHYASVSGTTQRGAKGPRWQSQAAIPPGSTFVLQLLWRRKLSVELAANFSLALRGFLCLGTLGLRGTRGLGAFYCEDERDAHAIEQELMVRGFVLRWRERSGGFGTYEEALRDYAAWLRHDFRKSFKAKNPSPLGTSNPRQASGIRFRCFKNDSGRFGWLAYEAPHSRVLGQASGRVRPLLEEKAFVGAPPVGPAPRKRF